MSNSNLPPGVTLREIDEHETHELDRCTGCNRLCYAASLNLNGECPKCLKPDEEPAQDS